MSTPARTFRHRGAVRHAGAIAAAEGCSRPGKVPTFAGGDFAEGFLKSRRSSHLMGTEWRLD
jgi:hypothetical protein